MYEMNTEAYGTVQTEGPGDGKLADTVISKAMSYNTEGGANFFKVTSAKASENLYIKTVGVSRYVDTMPRFGFPADRAGKYAFRWTYQNVATSLPTHWHNLWIKKVFDTWGFRHKDQSCNRWIMGYDGECYHFDGGPNTNKRCFSGGALCSDGAWPHHTPFKNIQMYLKIIY
eukprot:Skav233196  [mRNA]  locus=scaffold24:383286:393352:- [translate_table: standard]